MQTTQADKVSEFRVLHEGPGTFVIPNPWDGGTARFFGQLGFRALATTSAGSAFSLGLPDQRGALSREMALAHISELVAVTDLPVSADFESGYANDPVDVAESVRLCLETGVAGLSIEDSQDDPTKPLFELAEAAERVQAARQAIDVSGTGAVLTARAECFLMGHSDPLRESIRRLQAYAEVGADVLYAPGLRTREQIAAVVKAVAPKPVNVLMSAHTGLTIADLAELGVRRISVGSALARVGWGAVMRAAREIVEQGTFEELGRAASFDEVNALFKVRA